MFFADECVLNFHDSPHLDLLEEPPVLSHEWGCARESDGKLRALGGWAEPALRQQTEGGRHDSSEGDPRVSSDAATDSLLLGLIGGNIPRH